MFEHRPAEPEDLPAIRALPGGASWEAGADDTVAEAITRDEPGVFRMVTCQGAAVVGYARLSLPPRPRVRHIGAVEFAATGPAAGAALLLHLREIAFQRMGLLRLDVNLEDPDPLTAALAATGFSPWIRRLGGWRHQGLTKDLITWGQLADGIVAAPFAPATVPRPSVRPLVDVVIRPATEADAPAWAHNLRHPSVMWGTHQTGTIPVAAWRRRLSAHPIGERWAVEHEGAVVAQAGLDPLPGARAHVLMLGISIARQAQGLGVGDKLMGRLIEAGRAQGASRIELQVYADNHRAEALYTKHGFVDEGTAPLGAWRDGDWAWDRCMALAL